MRYSHFHMVIMEKLTLVYKSEKEGHSDINNKTSLGIYQVVYVPYLKSFRLFSLQNMLMLTYKRQTEL